MKRALFLLALIIPGLATAENPDSAIPPALQPWIGWVKDKQPERICSLLGEERVCSWPGKLVLDLNEKGGSFQMTAFLERRARIELPGGEEIWPLDVSGDTSGAAGSRQPLTVLSIENKPSVLLEKGRYNISGRFGWDEMPKSLPLPADTGLVDLKVNGAKVPLPKLGDSGELWLQEETEAEEAEADTVQYSVSRKLVDGVPFHIVTQIELRVAGKARELALGNILLAGSKPLTLESDLSYKIDKNWNVTIQLKPGVYHVTIDAVLPQPPESLAPPKVKADNWPQEEYWVFQPDAEFRAVDLSGVPAIDPNRTRLPDDWKSLSAYVITSKEAIAFKETRRGEPEVPPNKLDLFRNLWLDLDGGGYTISEQLSGQMSRNWRLDMQAPTKLTNVTVNGTNQVITEGLDSKLPGVEIRSENVNLAGISRLEIPGGTLPAVGWDHDVNSLRLDLHAGPGWTLFEALGADNDARTWLSTWRLWDIFFVVLMSIAAGKLLGRKVGVVSFLALSLCHDQFGAPVYIWLNLLAGKALLQALPAGRFRKVVEIYYVLAFGLLLSVLVPFAIDQIRLGLYPQLTPAFRPGEVFTMVLGPTLFLSAFAAGIASIVFLFRKMFRYSFQLFLLAGLLLFGAVAASAFFSGLFFGSGYQGGTVAYNQMASDMAAAPAPVPQSRGGEILARKRAPAELEEKMMIRDSSSLGGAEPEQDLEAARLALVQVDPKAVVQTGSAAPSWQWRTWSLVWNGPVEKNRTIQLFLIGPRLNCLLSFLRVMLLVALAAAFLKALAWRKSVPNVLPAFFLAFVMTGEARAQEMPSNDLLNELEQRVYRDSCTSDCTSVSSLKLDVNGEELTISATVSSEGPGAWPIPGPLDQLSPTSVTLGKENVTEFRRSGDGLVWVRIPAGTHDVVVKGSVRGRNILTLQFGLTPEHVEAHASGWDVDGLSPTGSPQETLQLIRRAAVKEEKEEKGGEEEIRLADWYVLTREFGVALPWTITNTASRLGDIDRAQIIKVPLVKGESVTGSTVKVENSVATITFPRNERQVTWTSSLTETPLIELAALKDTAVSENWIIRCSAIWRCSYEGIAPIRSRDSGEAAGVYHPWPGEKLKVKVERPQGMAGQTLTIDQAYVAWRPGSGLLQADLNMSVRSSQGGWRKIQLPEGASLESVAVNGIKQTLALEGRDLSLPIVPGVQQFDINWRQPWTSGILDRMPPLNLGADTANVRMNVRVPERRWLLWAGGPAWGPAVLFWGELIVVVLFGLLLGRLKVPPLKSWQWILLGLGMATLHPAFMFLPALCFWLHSIRARTILSERWKFNAFQIFLAVLSAVTVVVLFISIYHGLIVEPDMGVSGNNSSNGDLNWFVDRSGANLPQPWILSAPLWIWKSLMVLWSAWLVFAVMRWMKWSWESFSTQGMWKGKIEV